MPAIAMLHVGMVVRLTMAVEASVGPLSIDLVVFAFTIGPLTLSLNVFDLEFSVEEADSVQLSKLEMESLSIGCIVDNSKILQMLLEQINQECLIFLYYNKQLHLQQLDLHHKEILIPKLTHHHST